MTEVSIPPSKGAEETSLRVMTYDEIASTWGLKPESARQLVRRKGWRRLPGNDGRTRIEVPTYHVERPDVMSSEEEVDTPQQAAVTPSEGPSEGGLTDAVLTALNRHIERIEAEIVDLKGVNVGLAAERDQARDAVADLRVQVAEAEARAIAAETRTADHAAERDRWHTMATTKRHWWPFSKRIAS